MATIESVNNKLISSFSISGIGAVIFWLAIGIIFIAVCVGGYYVYYQRQIFNKRITAFEIINGTYNPAIRDVAKTVKIGTGGFEILYLKKQKIFRIAYGGRVGRGDYYFFILPDGYWVNGMLSADVKEITKNGGLIPVITTNPSMRTQYTALERMIDSLHTEKKKFWDQYGMWILSISFVLVAGVMLYLNYQEFVKASEHFSTGMDVMAKSLDRLQPSANIPSSNLIPVK